MDLPAICVPRLTPGRSLISPRGSTPHTHAVQYSRIYDRCCDSRAHAAARALPASRQGAPPARGVRVGLEPLGGQPAVLRCATLRCARSHTHTRASNSAQDLYDANHNWRSLRARIEGAPCQLVRTVQTRRALARTSASAVQALNDLLLLQLGTRHAAHAHGVEVRVQRLHTWLAPRDGPGQHTHQRGAHEPGYTADSRGARSPASSTVHSRATDGG
jgi:hypothetical protein